MSIFNAIMEPQSGLLAPALGNALDLPSILKQLLLAKFFFFRDISQKELDPFVVAGLPEQKVAGAVDACRQPCCA